MTTTADATPAPATPDHTTPDHTTQQPTGTVIGTIDELPVGTKKMLTVDGHRVCVVRTESGVYAVDQACPHEGYGLTTGQLDGDVLTCAWHNWKFDVTTGDCVLGEEGVTGHPVQVTDQGEVHVSIRRPDPAADRPRLLASMRSGMERDYIGQVSRDVIRLLRADTNPGELAWEAVAYGAPRAEYGWGHAIASLTDCLAMVEHLEGDQRALPVVQGIAGVAEEERGRAPRPLAVPLVVLPRDPRRAFRAAVEAEQLDEAQAVLRAAIAAGAGASELRPWFTDVVADHLLSYGHGAIYAQKAFQLLARIGWDRADTVLPHLVPTIVYGTREDTLPYMKLFLRGLADVTLDQLAEQAARPAMGWQDDGQLVAALLGRDRTAAARAAHTALRHGASLHDVLDAVVVAVSERMLRYDVAGERDLHDDFGWLDITHGLTYANAARWHMAEAGEVTVDHVRLVMWTVFLANWTGRHEWHTAVGPRHDVAAHPDDLAAYGRALQHEALLDGTSRFIVHAHAVKMSVAATEEAQRLGSPLPLDATARFLRAPKLERFVAANVTRSIDFLSGKVARD